MSDNDPVYTYELKPMPAVPCIWQRHLWPHVPLGPLGTHPDTEVRALADGSLEFDVTTDGVKTRYTSTDEGGTWIATVEVDPRRPEDIFDAGWALAAAKAGAGR